MRVLVVTAVPAERDAVTRAFGAGSRVREVPGGEV
ncbi:futalosine hydrolase, partial [Streptomyces sp. FT05W]